MASAVHSQAPDPSNSSHASLPTRPPPQPQHTSSHMPPSAQARDQARDPRPRIFFGPYQLLQTLGEGEFGKVKLGIHAERCEEAAIKLIKKSAIKDKDKNFGEDKGWGKVKREVNVLKIVKHPNIVSLYDVIETEKYIGIVLEYASGGELFDHILAHRYLKERDACKLFAQLVSGVSYLHAKKIVHRDLKLENLLLDRNRNIIITDFGFANRFADREDNLMATSCGSPCYAAPELVVQEGKYQGNGVDVWSCGVILYAMLAGYLPFDDDPQNPEGDNINLLYKYILATPLSFPDWITPDARALLLTILVPDPARRATLEDIMYNRWLEQHQNLFAMTVPELEAASEDRILRNRLALANRRRQPKVPSSHPVARSQSSSIPTGNPDTIDPHVPATTNPLYTSAPESRYAPSGVSSSSASFNPNSSNREGVNPLSASVLPSQAKVAEPSVDTTAHYGDTRWSFDAKNPRASSAEISASKRYTVQVEYDSSVLADLRATDHPSTTISKNLDNEQEIHDTTMKLTGGVVKNRNSRDLPAQVEETQNLIELSDDPDREDALKHPKTTDDVDSTARNFDNIHQRKDDQRSNVCSDEQSEKVISETSSVPFPGPEKRPPSQSTVRVQPGGHVIPVDTSKTLASSDNQGEKEFQKSRHRKGLSFDKTIFSRLLASSSGSSAATPQPPIATRDSPRSSATHKRKDSFKRYEPRRKALSMVGPSPGTAVGTNAEQSKPSLLPKQLLMSKGQDASNKAQNSEAQGRSGPYVSSVGQDRDLRALNANGRESFKGNPPVNGGSSSYSNSKARKIMDWFRQRTLARDMSASGSHVSLAQSLNPSYNADPSWQDGNPAVKGGSSKTGSQTPFRNSIAAPTYTDRPKVVVTGERKDGDESKEPTRTPSTRSASGGHSNISESTVPPNEGNAINNSSDQERINTFDESDLNWNTGAFSDVSLTQHSPPDVVNEIRQALWTLGVDVVTDGRYKFRCLRRSRKRPVTSGFSFGGSSGFSKPDRLEKRLPGVTSPVSASSSFRSFFTRRNSSSTASLGSMGQMNWLNSSMISENAPTSTEGYDGQENPDDTPSPYYGENDSGGEVRFTIEITRLRNLTGIYNVDIRRLKGSLWDFKTLYQAIIPRLNLASQQ